MWEGIPTPKLDSELAAEVRMCPPGTRLFPWDAQAKAWVVSRQETGEGGGRPREPTHCMQALGHAASTSGPARWGTHAVSTQLGRSPPDVPNPPLMGSAAGATRITNRSSQNRKDNQVNFRALRRSPFHLLGFFLSLQKPKASLANEAAVVANKLVPLGTYEMQYVISLLNLGLSPREGSCSEVRDSPGFETSLANMVKPSSLLKIQKLAERGGGHLESQLPRRLRQEKCLNPGGGGCRQPISRHCTTAWVT
ncbi:hypothetical protein AAY473_006376 [Plecturocebus cupreus]